MSNRRNPIDPAVASLITEGERKQRIRRSPKGVQAKIRKDASRQRVTYDIPEELQRAISDVAEREGLSASCVVALLLADGVCRHRRGLISFYGLKRPSRSPRYEWTVDASVVEEVLQGKRVLGDGEVWE